LDKITKPYLPIAAGEYSKTLGMAISVVAGIFSLISSYVLSTAMFATMIFIFTAGTLYSHPLVFLKVNPFGAAVAIALSRGLVLNLGTFVHFSKAFIPNLGIEIPFSVAAFAFFCFTFCITIAMMKDAPDIIGDHKFGVQTLAVRLGAKPVMLAAVGLLSLAYIGLSFAIAYDYESFHSAFISIAFHLSVVITLWYRLLWSGEVDFTSAASLYAYYMVIWKLLYLEYVVFSVSYHFRNL